MSRSTSRLTGISAGSKSIPRHGFSHWRRQSLVVLRLNALGNPGATVKRTRAVLPCFGQLLIATGDYRLDRALLLGFTDELAAWNRCGDSQGL
jgi:hypothetical protein